MITHQDLLELRDTWTGRTYTACGILYSYELYDRNMYLYPTYHQSLPAYSYPSSKIKLPCVNCHNCLVMIDKLLSNGIIKLSCSKRRQRYLFVGKYSGGNRKKALLSQLELPVSKNDNVTPIFVNQERIQNISFNPDDLYDEEDESGGFLN